MDESLMKHHKRQVWRTVERVIISEPDITTPDESRAAPEASRPRGVRAGASFAYNAPASSAAKVEGS
jgi:hypothetical protein